jgi:hypothetical protein
MTQIGFPYLGESNCDMCSEIVNFVRWKLALAGFEGNVWSWLSEDSSMFVIVVTLEEHAARSPREETRRNS